MAEDIESLNPKKQQAITALLENPTVAGAAEAAGIGHRTLTRWLAEDNDFKAALRDAQRRALDRAIAQLAGAAPLAANALAEIAVDRSFPASARIQAASKILSELRTGIQLVTLSRDIENILERINDLERRS